MRKAEISASTVSADPKHTNPSCILSCSDIANRQTKKRTSSLCILCTNSTRNNIFTVKSEVLPQYDEDYNLT